MKNAFLPETNNDSIFVFVGNPKAMLLIIFIVLTALIMLMIHKMRKGDKK